MSPLSAAPPRPRTSLHAPSYPAIVAATVAAMAGCAAHPSQQAPAPPIEIAKVELGATSAAAPPPASPDNPAAPSAEAPWRTHPGSYPSDQASVAIGCGGGCPPAWQLEADYRDRRQALARMQHCYDLVGGGKRGWLRVSLSIDGQGRAQSVRVERSGDLPEPVELCAEELLGSVKFHATNNYARTPGYDEEYPKKQREQL